MLARTLFRSFKTWAQYQAECLGITEQEYHASIAVEKQGHYDLWRHRTEVRNKINFLLDHCSAEEQKHYLKEFTTEDLTRYLLNELNNLSKDEVQRVAEVKVTYSVLPGVNALMKLSNCISRLSIQTYEHFPADSRPTLLAKNTLENKLKELEWRKIDQAVSSQ